VDSLDRSVDAPWPIRTQQSILVAIDCRLVAGAELRIEAIAITMIIAGVFSALVPDLLADALKRIRVAISARENREHLSDVLVEKAEAHSTTAPFSRSARPSSKEDSERAPP